MTIYPDDLGIASTPRLSADAARRPASSAIAGRTPIGGLAPELVVLLPREDGTFRLTWLSHALDRTAT